MIIRNFIYFMPIIISIMGIVSIVLSLKTKNRKNNKYIIIMDIINITYLFVISMLIHNLLSIIVDLSFLIIWFISFFGGIFYVVSIIICLLNRKKINGTSDNKNVFKFVLITILMPIILFTIILCREIYLINNSVILLSYHSSGNGGFGNSNDFTYVISDNYCKEISIDIRYSDLFIPKDAKRIDENELQKLDYKIVLDGDNYIMVYKKNKLIHKKRINKKYFNIDLKKIYYNY